MKIFEFQQDTSTNRKAFMFWGALLAGVLWLVSPFSCHEQVRPAVRAVPVKPTPLGATGTPASSVVTGAAGVPAVVAPAAISVPPPVPDPLAPFAKMLGKWEGDQTITAHRGCRLDIEVREIKDKDKPFEGYSTLSCLPYPVELWRGTLTRKTSAILQGVGEAGENPVIEFQVANNIGVPFSLDKCAMASLSLQSFGDGRVAAHWRETGGTANCIGGEVVMTPRKNY